MKYPNNNCGECVVWLALGEEDGISKEEAISKHCVNCKVYTNQPKCYEIHFNHSYTHSYTYVKACSEQEAVSKFHKKYPKRYYSITDVWEVKD